MHTYLLYFAFFHGSRNDVFSHLTAMFVNIPFNKDHTSIKNLSA